VGVESIWRCVGSAVMSNAPLGQPLEPTCMWQNCEFIFMHFNLNRHLGGGGSEGKPYSPFGEQRNMRTTGMRVPTSRYLSCSTSAAAMPSGSGPPRPRWSATSNPTPQQPTFAPRVPYYTSLPAPHWLTGWKQPVTQQPPLGSHATARKPQFPMLLTSGNSKPQTAPPHLRGPSLLPSPGGVGVGTGMRPLQQQGHFLNPIIRLAKPKSPPGVSPPGTSKIALLCRVHLEHPAEAGMA